MEIKELLQTLPAVSGSDFTIWKTESENYPYVLISYSFYNEKDGVDFMQIRSGTNLGNFITGCYKVSGSSSNSGYYMYDSRVYYYDLASNEWVLVSNHTKKNTASKITIGEEELKGSAETIIFSTRDIWTANKYIGHAKDYRLLLSGRKRVESPLDDIFTEEHLNQLGYQSGDHLLRMTTSAYDCLYVFKGVTATSIATSYVSTSSNYLSLTFPTCESVRGLCYTISSATYSESTTIYNEKKTTCMFDDYVTFSTLDITFNNRLMRLKDDYVTGVRDEILSIDQTSIDFSTIPTFTGQTSPEGLEIETVIPFEDVINPDNIQESVIFTFRAGNAYPYEHEILMANPEILPESITATPATIEDFIGTTHQLSVEVLPEEAEDKNLSFISDNLKVATIDENGLVELVGEGTATITITSNRVTDLSTQVIVTAIRPYEKPIIDSLTISPETPQEGQDVEFTYDVTYDRATFKAEEWENKQNSYEAGRHTVRVRVQDSNDLWSDWKELTFTVKAVYQKPTISNLVMTPANPSVGEKVSFNYDKSLDKRLELKSENWTNKKSSYEVGTHTVKLTITDSANQVSNELSVTFSIEQPLEVPVIRNLRITPESPKAGQPVTFSYDSTIDSRLTLKEEKWTGKQASYPDGTHTVSLQVVDSAGQVSNELSLTFDVAYVPEVPVLKSIKMTPEHPKAGESVSFTYESDLDERATVQEEIWENKKASYEAGNHEVSLVLIDSFGQQSNRKTISFSVERIKDKPVISNLRMTPENPTVDDDITFTYDMVIDHELTLKSENWVNKKSRYDEGTHTVSLSVTDSADQVSNALSLTFNVAYVPEAPVLDSISITPQNPFAGETVEFNYVAYIDDRAAIKEEIWEGKQDIYAEGDYEVALTIVDSFNQHSNRLTFPFTVEALPQPELPEPPAEDLPSIPDGFPCIYDIAIDPPNPRAGELLSYSYTIALEAGTCLETMVWTNKRMIYDEAGEFEMALKVIDSKGREATKVITVKILEPSETPHPQKPIRVKHLEVTRWDSASKRFMILEGREK